ncbi:MAG: hypothetical protein AAF715_13885 [Myxococcota bacterium]
MTRLTALISLILVSLTGCSTEVVVSSDEDDAAADGTPEPTPNDDPTQFACEAPVPEAAFEATIDTSAWTAEAPDDPEFDPSTLTIESTCTVSAVGSSNQGRDFDLALDCENDQPLSVRLRGLPQGLVVDLEAAQQVRVDYRWNSDAHHLSEAEWLLIQADDRVLLGVLDGNGVGGMGDEIVPFGLAVDDSICASPCDGGDSICSDGHRLAVALADAPEADGRYVLDGNMGTLADHRFVVARAEGFSCINCESTFRILIVAEP